MRWAILKIRIARTFITPHYRVFKGVFEFEGVFELAHIYVSEEHQK